MAETVEVRVPDLGTDEKVDVVEILVAAGDTVAADDGLITLESDKASMDVPSPHAGVVETVKVRAGDRIGEGDLILTMNVGTATADAEPRAVGNLRVVLKTADDHGVTTSVGRPTKPSSTATGIEILPSIKNAATPKPIRWMIRREESFARPRVCSMLEVAWLKCKPRNSMAMMYAPET